MKKLIKILYEIQIKSPIISTDKLMDTLWVDLPNGEATEEWTKLVTLLYQKYKYWGSLDFEEVTDWVDSLKPTIKNSLYEDILKIISK